MALVSQANVTNFALQQLRRLSAEQGQHEKAMLVPHEVCGSEVVEVSRGPLRALTFAYNPAEVKWTHTVNWNKKLDSGSDSASKSFGGNPGRSLDLGTLIFDTFEARTCVRERYMDTLESMARASATSDKAPAFLRLVWGRFTGKASDNTFPYFVIEKLEIRYTMFLPNGTPVRANVTVSLKEATPPELAAVASRPVEPDETKHVVVKQGDTLQGLAYACYGDPCKWRLLADANGIDDPMSLPIGRVLHAPRVRPTRR